MKQLILPFRSGKPSLAEVPAPAVQAGEVLIRNTASVVSAGTERMLIEFGKAGWIGKAKAQPERARQVLTKLKTDGLLPTIRAVKSKLDKPIPLGYSSAGVVLAVGSGVHDIGPGERVASNGPHAEVVSVPRNLVAKIPEGVGDEEAAFTTLGAIALQGIRLAAPTFGECIVVIGLGLIGQLTAQLLLANGCRVFGIEPSSERRALAATHGVIPLVGGVEEMRAQTGGFGADAVIITASARQDSLIAEAADMSRKRGRIVLTGVVNMQLSRDRFFKKELSFQVSSSYGPGRYDRAYEHQGLDYPIGYVRWTENRNFEAVLQALQQGQLDVKPLISARIPFAEAETAYAENAGLATIFQYPSDALTERSVRLRPASQATSKGRGIALIGAGNFASAMLLPALKKAGALPQSIISRNGLSAAVLAKRFGIAEAGSEPSSLWDDERIGSVVIATPHASHALLTVAALQAGKDVLVEKPLALTRQELEAVREAVTATGRSLTVGFNRRFAPFTQQAKQLMRTTSLPCNICITVNAGSVPAGHWLSDREGQGGRLVGEACHFIDLCQFLAGGAITAVCANQLAGTDEDVCILLRFANGSQAVVNYFCNGAREYDKERMELYSAGRTLVIENWRRLRAFGFGRRINKSAAQDKGHQGLIAAWVTSLAGGAAPIAAEEALNSTCAAIAAVESLAAGGWVEV